MKTAGGFEKHFRVFSYLAALCGLLALFVSGGVGVVLFSVFVIAALFAWRLEDTRWQLSDRVSLLVVILAVVLFIADWQLGVTGLSRNQVFAASGLARLILVLGAVKLLQKKADKDWIFVYLISFFEILLSAGMSASPLFLIPLILYLIAITCAIIAFEIRRTARGIEKQRQINPNKSINPRKIVSSPGLGFGRLLLIAVALLSVVTVLAIPVFFALPRVGGAGIGGDISKTTRITGFSDSVTLGAIGRLRRNNAAVMRVRIDRNDNPRLSKLLWRGVALDRFDKKRWKKSLPAAGESFTQLGRNRFVLGGLRRGGRITVQTIYLEPLNTNVLFALPEPVMVLGNAAQVRRDSEGGITSFPPRYSRFGYRVYSDTQSPDPEKLREDPMRYRMSEARYLALPSKLDPRISRLAAGIIDETGADNAYDIARALENHLQTAYGYTLDLKASGEDPLSDFLFNVREGHCEYFATALAIMLRTQGIATRVVNGFQQGDYNRAADVYVVKQKDAHSWVEVYFPRERVWITFDPTPFGGQYLDTRGSSIFAGLNDYIEALETYWIQYFVAYDTNEQRSLFRSFQEKVVTGGENTAVFFSAIQSYFNDWWREIRGDNGIAASLLAVAYGIGYILAAGLGVLLLMRLLRSFRRSRIWQAFVRWFGKRRSGTDIEFYTRLQDVLKEKGLEREPHQTPLEFAFASGYEGAVQITEKYHSVRFGGKKLSDDETDEIEKWFEDIEAMKKE